MEANIKAKFFALYLGYDCRRLLNETVNAMFPPDKVNGAVIDNIASGKYPESHLLLRTIGQLTDEEVGNCMKLCGGASEEIKRDNDHIETSFASYKLLISHTGYISFSNSGRLYNNRGIFCVIDYLRSIGILLPFTYLNEQNTPTTLSVDDILGMGWVKIEGK